MCLRTQADSPCLAPRSRTGLQELPRAPKSPLASVDACDHDRTPVREGAASELIIRSCGPALSGKRLLAENAPFPLRNAFQNVSRKRSLSHAGEHVDDMLRAVDSDSSASPFLPAEDPDDSGRRHLRACGGCEDTAPSPAPGRSGSVPRPSAAPQEHYDAPFQGGLALAAPPDPANRFKKQNLSGRSSRVTQVAALAPLSPVAVASVQRADDAPAAPAAVVAPATSLDVLCFPALLSCLRNRDLRHLCLTTPVVHNKSPYLPASRVRLIAVPPWPEKRYKRRTPLGYSSRATPVADSDSTPTATLSRDVGVASTNFGHNFLPGPQLVSEPDDLVVLRTGGQRI